MSEIIIVLYLLTMTLITGYCLVQFDLALRYIQHSGNRKPVSVKQGKKPSYRPFITIQLPVYNEKYVVERLIRAVVKMNYPFDRLEIQVLDDSTDETSRIISNITKELGSKGIRIEHLQRGQRSGFKAGALQEGLKNSSGEYIAIFDADFVPERNFLQKTIPWFTDPKIGLVQARWGHINEDHSLLTRLQAFGLNAHFSIEQVGRESAGSFINFNGTAGIWRRSCVLDAGGWSADTLSEDLDLSFRAQMKGWKFKYLEQVVAPAELPVLLSAVRTQQYRWTKGGAENAKKILGSILKAPIHGINKLHAVVHITNSIIFPLVLLAAVLSIPLLYIRDSNPDFSYIFDLGSIFMTGFIGIGFFYWVSAKHMHPQKTLIYYLLNFPLFLSFTMGLSFQNAVAVIEGFTGIKTPFIRTPKFATHAGENDVRDNAYRQSGIKWQYLIEFFFVLYFLFGIETGISLGIYGMIPFHLMLVFGFAGIIYYSLKPGKIYETGN